MHWKIHKEGRVFVENCLRERGNTEDTNFRTAIREECIITRGGGVKEREKTCELANQNRGSSAHEKDPEGSNSRDSRNVISKEVQGRRGGEDLNGKEKDEVVRGRLNDHRWIPYGKHCRWHPWWDQGRRRNWRREGPRYWEEREKHWEERNRRERERY